MRCTVNDAECSEGRLRRGLCEKHYRRALHSGSTASPQIDIWQHYSVAADTSCWEWAGALWRNGYGKTSRSVHGTRLAHRAYFAEHRGPIPDGMDLDHLCRNRLCVNPDHLEPVSRAVNLDRGLDARTSCRSGRHDISAPSDLIPGTKQCVHCWRIRYKEAGERYRARKQ
jgi:hypothetical protein